MNDSTSAVDGLPPAIVADVVVSLRWLNDNCCWVLWLQDDVDDSSKVERFHKNVVFSLKGHVDPYRQHLNGHYPKSQNVENVHVFHVLAHVPGHDLVHVLFVCLYHVLVLAPFLFLVRNYLRPPAVDDVNYSIWEVESAFVAYSSCALEICDDF